MWGGWGLGVEKWLAVSRHQGASIPTSTSTSRFAVSSIKNGATGLESQWGGWGRPPPPLSPPLKNWGFGGLGNSSGRHKNGHYLVVDPQ